MATLCKNCGAPLVFDPVSQRVVCNTCGSSWTAEEVESTVKEFVQDVQAVSVGEAAGAAQEFMDCHIYTCSSCGGEIMINGSEASTKCIYCGSSSVVFNRIAKEKAPDYILPFKISKEDAVERIRKMMKHRPLIPKDVKNFEPTAVRGIYIPFWIVNARHVEADIVRGTVKHGKHSVTRYFGRAGTMSVYDLPIDGSLMLSDESSQRLEPFDLSDMKPFDEDYLLGFYSNVSDIKYKDLREAVTKRAGEAFQSKVVKSVAANNKKIQVSRQATQIDREIKYAMLPVWFVSFDYLGKHNTIMINGTTGKIVCGLPMNKKLFWGLVAGIGLALTAVNAWVLSQYIMPAFIYQLQGDTVVVNGNAPGGFVFMAFIITAALLAVGWTKMSRVLKQIERSQSNSIFNFMKKRQE